MKNDLQIEFRSIESLIPYARNSRAHPEEQVAQIAASIEEFGFTNPVLVDESGEIIAGHGRVLAARKLGLKKIPTISLKGMTDAQKKAYVIADNKLAENSSWDMAALAGDLTSLGEIGFDLGLTGFDEDELQKIIELPEDLQEKSEKLRPLKWTRILVSIPIGVETDGLNEQLKSLVARVAQVDYAGN